MYGHSRANLASAAGRYCVKAANDADITDLDDYASAQG
jgi:hypothetical protein